MRKNFLIFILRAIRVFGVMFTAGIYAYCNTPMEGWDKFDYVAGLVFILFMVEAGMFAIISAAKDSNFGEDEQ